MLDRLGAGSLGVVFKAEHLLTRELAAVKVLVPPWKQAESPLLAASEASHASVLDRTRISELPVRDGSSAELVVLAPGVVNTTNLRPRKAAFTGGLSQLIANGGQQYGNELTLAGAFWSSSSAKSLCFRLGM